MNKASQHLEELLEMGQDNEKKGAKAVIEIGERERKKQTEKEFYLKEDLSKHKNKNIYREAIRNEAKKRISEYNIPKGFMIDCVLTSKGLAFGYRYFTDKMWFMKGITISQNPLYDLQGVERRINEALDEIGRRENGFKNEHKTAGGLIV